jgi:hypothetical protein
MIPSRRTSSMANSIPQECDFPPHRGPPTMEQMPPHWQAAGTTGYDALADLYRVLVDPLLASR